MRPCLCPATLTSMVPRGLLTAARAWVRAGLCIRALDPGRGAVFRSKTQDVDKTRLLPGDKKHSQYNPNNRAHTLQGYKYGSFAACQKACDGPGAVQCTGFELRANLHGGVVECVLYSWPFIGNETVEWRLKTPRQPGGTLSSKNFTGPRGGAQASGDTTFYRTKCTTAPSPIAKDSCGVAMADC